MLLVNRLYLHTPHNKNNTNLLRELEIFYVVLQIMQWNFCLKETFLIGIQ